MKLGKLHLVVIVMCLLTIGVYGQSVNLKQPLPLVNYPENVDLPLNSKELLQLKEVYGDELQSFVLNRPNFLKAIKDILRNRVEIIEYTNPRDQKDCMLLSEVPVLNAFVPELKRDQFFDKSNFNPLKYNFRFFSRGASIYHVDNTNYYIKIKAQHRR